MDRIRSPRSGPVRPNGWRILQQRDRLLPEALDALGGAEQRVIAAHRVVDEAFVGLEQIGAAPGLVKRELQALLVEDHARSGPLAVEREREFRRVCKIEREVD